MKPAIYGMALLLAASVSTATAQQRQSEPASPSPLTQQRAANVDCLQQTGSRIVAAENAHTDRRQTRGPSRANTSRKGCAAGPGRVYTREDIERTGAIDMADALRQLDPAMR